MPGALAVVGSNPTGPTNYMGSYTVVMYYYAVITARRKLISTCQQS
jgi:hypothetical protein